MYSAESINVIEGVRIEKTRRDVIYYTIRFKCGSISQGSNFQGFGDPFSYHYALGAPLYTNIVVMNRVPDTTARWWALGELRVSLPGASVEDVMALITSLVFRFSIVRPAGNNVDLYKAPLMSLPSDEGMGLARHNFDPATNTFQRAMLHTQPIPSALPIGFELTAGKELTLENAVDLYVMAHVIYFYPFRDKRTEKEPPKSMSAPSGVRFTTDVLDRIKALVDSGAFSSKSHFVRNAVDEALQREGGS